MENSADTSSDAIRRADVVCGSPMLPVSPNLLAPRVTYQSRVGEAYNIARDGGLRSKFGRTIAGLGNYRAWPDDSVSMTTTRLINDETRIDTISHCLQEAEAEAEGWSVPFSESQHCVFSICVPELETLSDWLEMTQGIYEQEDTEEAAKTPQLLPDDVLAQTEKWGITDQVHAAFDIATEIYRSLRSIEVSVSIDPEIPERERIRITLAVVGAPEEVFEDELRFKKQLYLAVGVEACELITITYKWED